MNQQETCCQCDQRRPTLSAGKWLVHCALLLVVFTLVIRYFFVTGNFMAHPFYHRSDADAIYASQTILLLNDGDLFYNHHPGATVYMTQGAVHRLLGLFDDNHSALMQLADTSSSSQAEFLLTTAVMTGRIIALATVL
ncbi:hypothetical protein ACFLQR_00320, partial [Verrucomicrobiota bacterium]